MTDTTVYRRSGAADRRQVRRTLTVANAKDALGPITPGIEMYALCRGDYSLIDIIEHCLSATGPVNATISTWTAAGADLGFAEGFVSDGRVLSCRWLVDFSFPQRQPAYFALLVDRFGADAIRATANHAKFVILRNDAWSLVLRTSMNLNLNRRLESIEISDDPAMADYLGAVVNEAFAATTGEAAVSARPGKNKATLSGLGLVTDAPEALALHSDPAPYGQDVNRAGMAWD